jgi:type IV pilus assembly protein PilA
MNEESAFTLLELLIVMTIIGILASISIPKYVTYKARAFDTRAKSDLRNVAIAEEAYFVDAEAYISCAAETCAALPGIGALSKGVLLAVNATPTGFTGTSSHPKGSGTIFTWDTSRGGLLE